MTETDVLTMLRDNRNERGIRNWAEMDPADTGGLSSFGIGLTQLRKMAKKIGRDHHLSRQLWSSDVYDARVIALLIDDPLELTRAQVEEQVEQLNTGMLAHVFSSCDATLPRAPFALDLAKEWIDSKDPMRRSCGWGLIYEFSKFKGKKAPADAFFVDCISRIERGIEGQPMPVRESMKCALMGIGKRTRELNTAAVRVARTIQSSEPPKGEGNCEPFDVMKHLTSPYLKQKLGT